MVRCTAYCWMDSAVAHEDTAAKGVVDTKNRRKRVECGRSIVGCGGSKTLFSKESERFASLEVVENIAIRVPKGLKW